MNKCLGVCGKKEKARTEKREDVGVVLGAVRVDEALSELLDGGFDRALGLDGGDREGGDEREGAEDDEADECRREHARGDLRAPVLEDGFAIFRLGELEVMLEPAPPNHVQRRCGRPVDEVDDDAGRFLCLPLGRWRVCGNVCGELGL